jgi:hypothetical protein
MKVTLGDAYNQTGNTVVGISAQVVGSGSRNTAINNGSLFADSNGSYNNLTAIGASVFNSGNWNTAIAGPVSAYSSGNNNTVTAIGAQVKNVH